VFEEITTGDLNTTSVMGRNGERIYPCRCGQTHRGDYGLYEFGHHNCFHETELLGLPAGKDIQAICPLCGMSWRVKMEVENVSS